MPGQSAAQVGKGSGGPPGGTTRLLDDSTALAFAASVLEPEPASTRGLVLEPEPAGELGLSIMLRAWLEGPHAARAGTSSRFHGQHQSWLPGALCCSSTTMLQPNVASVWWRLSLSETVLYCAAMDSSCLTARRAPIEAMISMSAVLHSDCKAEQTSQPCALMHHQCAKVSGGC